VPHVRHLAADAPTYEPKPGERVLRLETAAEVPQLFVGIGRGEYLLAAPTGSTYVLTEEQYVRLQQQLAAQATYQAWQRDGLLTITDAATVPPDPPPPPDGEGGARARRTSWGDSP